MDPNRQYSLRQLLVAITIFAFMVGLPIATFTSSGIAMMVQLLICLPLLGGAIGSAFDRLREGAILGACLWEVALVLALIFRG